MLTLELRDACGNRFAPRHDGEGLWMKSLTSAVSATAQGQATLPERNIVLKFKSKLHLVPLDYHVRLNGFQKQRRPVALLDPDELFPVVGISKFHVTDAERATEHLEQAFYGVRTRHAHVGPDGIITKPTVGPDDMDANAALPIEDAGCVGKVKRRMRQGVTHQPTLAQSEPTL